MPLPVALGLAGAGLSAVGGIVKGIFGARQAKKAQKAIDNYRRQDLSNAFSDLQVSTLGADVQREELARSTATGVQALQAGGIRGLLGGIGKIQEANVAQSRQIGADLDMQQMQIQQMQAGDEVRIQQMQEQREREDLAGLGAQLSAGQQTAFSGIGDVASAAGSMLRMGGALGAAGTEGGQQTSNPFASTQKFLKDYNPANPFG